MTSKKCYSYPHSTLNNSLHSSPTQVSSSTNSSVAALLATRSMLNFGPFALAALAAAAAQQPSKDSYLSTSSRSPSPSTWPSISLATPSSSSSSSDRNHNPNHEIEAGEILTVTSSKRKRRRHNVLSNDQDNSLLSSSTVTTDLFDKQQLNMLRAHYALNPYPNANELHEISKRIGLSEQHVQYWFHVLRTNYAATNNMKLSTNTFIPSISTGANHTTPFLPLTYYHLRASLMAAATNNSSISSIPYSSKEQTEPLDLTVKKSHMNSGEQQLAAHLHMTATVAFNNNTNWHENKNEWIKVSN